MNFFIHIYGRIELNLWFSWCLEAVLGLTVGNGLVQYLTNSILLSYTWVKGGNPFWVGNETAPYNISDKKELVRPQQGNLYHLRPCRFQIWSFFKKLTIKEGVTASIHERCFAFNVFFHAPKYSWLRDFLFFNEKTYLQIFWFHYENLLVLKYKQKRKISQWQIIGSKQKYVKIRTLSRNWCFHTFLDSHLLQIWPKLKSTLSEEV
jgi:hypothetical protein